MTTEPITTTDLDAIALHLESSQLDDKTKVLISEALATAYETVEILKANDVELEQWPSA